PMSEPEQPPDRLHQLADDYLAGRVDEAGLRELEDGLRADPAARRWFVRYARLHTDLHLEMRARRTSERALGRLARLAGPGTPPRRGFLRRGRRPRVLVPAACLLLALAATGWLLRGRPGRDDRADPGPVVAWLVNAQDCTWAEEEPSGDMRPGKTLRLERGLA